MSPTSKKTDICNSHDALLKLIHSAAFLSDPQIEAILTEWNLKPNIALCVTCLCEQSILFVGEEIQEFTGYPAQDFMKEGLQGVVDKTSPLSFPEQMSKQMMYALQAKSPTFKKTDFLLQEYHWDTIWPNSLLMPIMGSTIGLTFNENGEFETAIGFILSDTPANQLLFKESHEALVKIKERHNTIYSHQDSPNVSPYKIIYTGTDYKNITEREKAVLSMLAEGFSTKEIAVKQEISHHTIETHRKSLLAKFKAKNTAELIKNATKVYWME